MNLTRCSKGHFYDADTNAGCPHCQQGKGNDETVIVQRSVNEDSVTVPLASSIKTAGQQKDLTVTVPANPVDDEITISFSKEKIGREPVVGWLVCIEGEHAGEDFRLKTGKNFIGRSKNMDAALTRDKSVSRDKHAIVLYEPKKQCFLVQPGEARELCYLNDDVVLSALELKRNDVISVGDSKLMFFPCCDSVFNWDMVTKEN